MFSIWGHAGDSLSQEGLAHLMQVLQGEGPVLLGGAGVVVVQEGHGMCWPPAYDPRRLPGSILQPPELPPGQRLLHMHK